MSKARTSLKKLRLMYEAVDRYLQLCIVGGGGVCECGDHKDDCDFIDRPCMHDNGYLCHWCQLDAARRGIDCDDVQRAFADRKRAVLAKAEAT